MAANTNSFTFASIGDLHVKDNQPGSCEMFGEISKSASALALCGDLTDAGTPTQAEILVKELRACTIPAIGVLGNHDCEEAHADQVKRTLCEGGVHLLDGQATEVNGVAFIGVKGFGCGLSPRMLSSFGEPAIKAFVTEAMNEAMRLEHIMRTVNNQRAVVVLHYPPVAETIEGEPPEIYPFLGCSRLAETIDRFKVSAIVHADAHRDEYEGRISAGARLQRCQARAEAISLSYALISV